MFLPFSVVRPNRASQTITPAGGDEKTLSATGTVLATLVVPQNKTLELLEVQATGTTADRLLLRSRPTVSGTVTVIQHLGHGANGGYKDVITTPQRVQLGPSADATADNRPRWELVSLDASSGKHSGLLVAGEV